MESELFKYLPTMAATIISQAESPDNMTSFIFDHNLTLMINKSGNVQGGLQVTTVKHHFPYLCITKELQKHSEICRFPFHILKEHLMVLSSDMDFLYLPFSEQNLQSFLMPSVSIGVRHCITVTDIDQMSLVAAPKSNKKGKNKNQTQHEQNEDDESDDGGGWLTGGIIDFVIGW
jgi:hypothetical protein